VNCDQIRELASEALDGSLTGSCASRFETHVDACPPCRAFLAEIKESLLLLEELPAIEVGDDFDRAVWSRIREEEVRVGWWESWGRRVSAFRESMSPTFARWSPVAVAAGAMTVFAVTSMPVDRVLRASEKSEPVEVSSGEPAFEREVVTAPIRSDARSPFAGLGTAPESNSQDSNLAAESSDEEIGIPRAVEAYLNSGRELRPKSTQQYLRSNYRYPLPRVSAGAVQVGVEGRPVYGPGSPAGAGGTTVISF
jgi:hypothetical protein